MAIETFGNNISTLVATNPDGADSKATADNHIRGIKEVLLAQFPFFTAPVTVAHTLLNKLGITATLGTNNTDPASTAFVQAAIASVNAQTSTVVAVVAGTSQAAVAGSHYILTSTATTVTLPATPATGDTVWVTWANTLATNVIARNGQTIMGLAEDLTLDATTNGTVQLRFVSSTWRIL